VAPVPREAVTLHLDEVHKLPVGRHVDKRTSGLVLTVRERPGLVHVARGSERTYTGRYWSFRYRTPEGKWREIGLGSAYAISLKNVRPIARELREQIDKGRAPVVRPIESPWPKSNRALAKEIGVSAETVNRARRMAEADGKEPRTRVTGRDGKTYPIRSR
jgi:hypothetical protein